MKKKKQAKEDPVLSTSYVIISMYECACMHSFLFVMLPFMFNNKKKEERERRVSDVLFNDPTTLRIMKVS